MDRPGQPRHSPPNFRLQRLDQQQYFGGFFVVQPRILGEGAVAAAGGDCLEGCEEGEQAGGLGIGGVLLEGGGDFRWIAAGQGLEDGERQAAGSALIFAAIAAVGEKGAEGLMPRIGGGRGIARRGFDVGENVPAFPGLSRMAKWRSAFDRAANGQPGLLKALEFAEGSRQIVPLAPFSQVIPDLPIDLRRPPTEGYRLLRPLQNNAL